MIEKRACDVTAFDIQSLITNRQQEEQRLDYKQAIPTKGHDLEGLTRHVVGMANTIGGMVLIGIEEERDDRGRPTGVPAGVCGLPGINLDSERLRVRNAIRDSVRPRMIPDLEDAIVLTDDGPVLVYRIRESLLKPHMFNYRFYARQGAQTVPLEVEQVRSGFLESEFVPQRLREYRAERLSSLLGGDAGTLFGEPPNFVVHVYPLSALRGGARVDVASVNAKCIAPPGYHGDFHFRLNFAGAVSFSGQPGDAVDYFQVFRNGCVEYATSGIVGEREGWDGTRVFRLRVATELLATRIPKLLRDLGPDVVEFPLAVMISFVGLRGAIAVGDDGYSCTQSIQEDSALLHELLMYEEPASWPSAMRDTLDSVWQAVGYDRCMCFDAEGSYTPPRTV